MGSSDSKTTGPAGGHRGGEIARPHLPEIRIDLDKVEHNTKALVQICQKTGMQVVAVTKGTCGSSQIARAMLRGGAAVIADSRVRNLRTLREDGITAKLMLLRCPRPSKAREVVRLADVSLNSELSTIQALGQEAVKQNTQHGVILMVDLGDRREGVMPNKLPELARQTVSVDGISLEGIGTNLACYGGVVPTSDKMTELVELTRQVEQEIGAPLATVSGGNSANIPLQLEEGHPKGVTQLRLGESILLGLETVGRSPVPGTYQDAFTVVGELVEVKRKPSLPDGEIAQDAFGETPEFEDRGNIVKGLVALGRQDIALDSLHPVDDGVEILGASSDHLVLALADKSWSVGDEVRFIPGYSSLIRVTMSPYVDVTFVQTLDPHD